MSIEIKMPNLSQTTDEVKLLKWMVKAGDSIKKGDVLCEVETDKVNMDVESFTEGLVLEIISEPQDMVQAGQVIAIIGEPGENTDKAAATNREKNIGAKKHIKPVEKDISTSKDHQAGKKIKATRLVLNMAEKNNIDLKEVQGTGPRGIITADDLKRHMEKDKGRAEVKRSNVIELNSNQLAVTANIAKSKKEIPHYYINTKVIADRILELIEQKGLSVYSCIIGSIAKALKDFPHLNSTYRDRRIHISPSINIGFAVSKGKELYVPVIKEADSLGISDIDNKVREMVQKVREGELSLSDVSGGTVTVSNLGIYDIDSFYGVINYPQALLIAMAKIGKELLIEEDNSMVIKNTFNLSASFDHRIANGAEAAGFLGKLKKTIEEEI